MPPGEPPADGRPADGSPEQAFGCLLGSIEAEVSGLYDRLGRMAADLEAAEADAGRESDWLDAMGRRLALAEIKSAVLDARHKLHGGLISVARARPVIPRRSHP